MSNTSTIRQKRKLNESAPTNHPVGGGESEKPITHHEHHYHDDGDLEIVSSDNVLFKVHSCEMQAASCIIRGMIENATASRLVLTDLEFETSAIFANLLNILLNNGSILSYTVAGAFKTFKLARKYEFDRLIVHARLQMSCILKNGTHNPFILRLAIQLKDYELCTQAIKCSALTVARPPIPKRPTHKSGRAQQQTVTRLPFLMPHLQTVMYDQTRGTWDMNPNSLSLEKLRDIPKEVFWAW